MSNYVETVIGLSLVVWFGSQAAIGGYEDHIQPDTRRKQVDRISNQLHIPVVPAGLCLRADNTSPDPVTVSAYERTNLDAAFHAATLYVFKEREGEKKVLLGSFPAYTVVPCSETPTATDNIIIYPDRDAALQAGRKSAAAVARNLEIVQQQHTRTGAPIIGQP